jgi:hypothetical protein
VAKFQNISATSQVKKKKNDDDDGGNSGGKKKRQPTKPQRNRQVKGNESTMTSANQRRCPSKPTLNGDIVSS